ncbi:MAG: pilus assembly protein TadE [Actinomycetota bacterium]|nr:pilus assembly protein TadE [Actinomycetota bacterium]
MLVLCGCLWAVGCVSAQLRCVDAAREGARAAARGESAARVLAVTTAVAPARSSVSVGRRGDQAIVAVSAQVRPLGGLVGRLLPMSVSASAAAAVEGLPARRGAPPPSGGHP